MFKYLRIDLNKNTKFLYYIKNLSNLFIPRIFYRHRLADMITRYKDIPYIQNRVAYYNKINLPYNISDKAITIKEFIKNEEKKTYYFDLLEYAKYFESNAQIAYIFGDVIHIPKYPSFVKSRPIEGNNTNSILLNLNKIRHFIFVNDTLDFQNKKNFLVWRGKAYIPHRQKFLKSFYNHPKCNVGQTNTKGDINVPWQKNKMTLSEQLKYKFILSIEGNDVASNLKWIMSSNSLCFMTKPKYETWFMEGTLIPDFHYVLLKDDYSDLEEKIDYYITHIPEAEFIINNAHIYIQQFQSKEIEDAISLLVINNYLNKQTKI